MTPRSFDKNNLQKNKNIPKLITRLLHYLTCVKN